MEYQSQDDLLLASSYSPVGRLTLSPHQPRIASHNSMAKTQNSIQESRSHASIVAIPQTQQISTLALIFL